MKARLALGYVPGRHSKPPLIAFTIDFDLGSHDILGNFNLMLSDLKLALVVKTRRRPHMRLEMELRRDPDFTRWVSDLLRSVLPQVQKLNFFQEVLGDFDTLQKRLQDEVSISNTVVPWIGLVAAWCRKPVD
jgi:hypothetical protein